MMFEEISENVGVELLPCFLKLGVSWSEFGFWTLKKIVSRGSEMELDRFQIIGLWRLLRAHPTRLKGDGLIPLF